jgi:hypothetical protein
MKRIIEKDLQKKRKLKLSLDWLSNHGAVNPNQQKQDGQITSHKNISLTKRHGEKKFQLNVEIMQKFEKQENLDKNLGGVYSEKIRDIEYNKLLSRVIERNQLKRNNNRYMVNVEDKDKVEDVMDEVLANGIKDQIFSNLNGVAQDEGKKMDLEALTKDTIKELLNNVNGIDTENFSDGDRRRDFLGRFQTKSNNINSLRLLQENLFLIKEVNPSVLTSVRFIRKHLILWETLHL